MALDSASRMAGLCAARRRSERGKGAYATDGSVWMEWEPPTDGDTGWSVIGTYSIEELAEMLKQEPDDDWEIVMIENVNAGH